jgi:hypothetical protein
MQIVVFRLPVYKERVWKLCTPVPAVHLQYCWITVLFRVDKTQDGFEAELRGTVWRPRFSYFHIRLTGVRTYKGLLGIGVNELVKWKKSK